MGTLVPRQKLIGYFFAFLAALGLAMYWLLPAGSDWRLLGIVLLIFCLPILLRNVWRYLMKQVNAYMAAPSPITSRTALAAREVNLTVEATFSKIVATKHMRADKELLELPCFLVLGSDGFSARLWRADKITGPWPNEETLVLNAEFLAPERALPCFPPGTGAQVLVGNAFIGTVKVLRHHAEETPASHVSG